MIMPASEFIRLLKHPVKFRLFLFYKLPAAYFSGVRIKEIDEQHCAVTIPYKWLTQNPFRSTYFASLSMAAELSTGTLAMAHTYKQKPAVSMLVTKVESTYLKKATGKTTFVCRDGGAFKSTIESAIVTGEGKVFTARSTGTNAEGEVVAEFLITWSFKAKKN
jgi:hypothetical protein